MTKNPSLRLQFSKKKKNKTLCMKQKFFFQMCVVLNKNNSAFYILNALINTSKSFQMKYCMNLYQNSVGNIKGKVESFVSARKIVK